MDPDERSDDAFNRAIDDLDVERFRSAIDNTKYIDILERYVTVLDSWLYDIKRVFWRIGSDKQLPGDYEVADKAYTLLLYVAGLRYRKSFRRISKEVLAFVRDLSWFDHDYD